jgi:ubiquitin carboxyl-terminal hydrolase 1
MPGAIPIERNGLLKTNRLSLKFHFQRKETKRPLDFTDTQEYEEKGSEYKGLKLSTVLTYKLRREKTYHL